MVAAGLTHVILEATSHGLAQERVAACDFDLAVVTNITHEHLDYHGSYEEYRAAKSKLFSGVPFSVDKPSLSEKGAILNRDDSSYEYLWQLLQQSQTEAERSIRTLTYGLHPQADVRAVDIEHQPDSIRFTAIGPGFSFPVRTMLAGAYNVSNCLAAITAGVGLLGVSSEAAQAGIGNLKGVPGRMERIDMGQDFTALVDFAHTPNALKNALKAVREGFPDARVIAVFGSAGLRDRAKRRMMAETSSELADLTVLTAEDPRTESLDTILAEMAAGAESRGGVEGETFWRVPDRGEAIRVGLRLARPGDVVVALGKGHEQSMCFLETEYDWDDRIAMRAALAELLGVPGPAMPYLPTQEQT
jgi:UDP-N-acetylmuramoyl-L-alanyl-D-glutamate--2,6-diaminopimelate ligase